MSVGTTLRTSGFTALLALCGESLTRKRVNASDETVTAIVNRRVMKVRDNMPKIGGRPNFDVMGFTEIEFLKTGNTKPNVGLGDAYVDSSTIWNRVRYVLETDITWVVYCQPSAV